MAEIIEGKPVSPFIQNGEKVEEVKEEKPVVQKPVVQKPIKVEKAKEEKPVKAEKVVIDSAIKPIEVAPGEFVLAKSFNCIKFADLLVKIENTGKEALAYKIMGGNSEKETVMIQLVKAETALAAGAAEEFKVENLSWKYYGIFVKSSGVTPTAVRFSAEPQKLY